MTRADNGIAIGVAGYAINQGNGEAFGGYFVNLKALGLVVNLKRVGEQNNNAVSLTLSDTRVVGLHDNGKRRRAFACEGIRRTNDCLYTSRARHNEDSPSRWRVEPPIRQLLRAHSFRV